MAFTKALIEVQDREAIDESRGLKPKFEVLFNPTEYTLSKGAQIAEINLPGLDSPLLQFVRGQNEKLTLDLFFDTTNTGMDENAKDVRELTKGFYQLVKIQPKTHAPPRIKFIWGQGLSFSAIVESVQQKFTLFNPLGIPLRATLTVSFREYKTLDKQLEELNPQSADHTKRRMVREGESLNFIAAQEYGDPQLWRLIADQNEAILPNPRKLTPGTVLEIPPTDAFDEPLVRRT
jgi:hypothetical protein